MYRKTALVIFIAIFSFSVSGLEVSINSTCASDREPMLSFYDDTDLGGHVGAPGYYSNQVCVKGERDFNVRQDCKPEEIKVLSLFSENNTHISMYSSYTYELCSKDTRGAIRDSCYGNETAAFSTISDNNSHIAGDTSYYSKKLCLFKQPPENITVSISGLSGDFYADDDPISQGETIRLAEFPYIVAEESGYVKGLASYTEFVKLSRPSDDKVSMTQKGPTFILPFTEGDHGTIEERQQLVVSSSLFSKLNPSFGFHIPEEPTVRVAFKPEQGANGFTGTLTNDIEIAVQNQGLEDGDLVINVEPT